MYPILLGLLFKPSINVFILKKVFHKIAVGFFVQLMVEQNESKQHSCSGPCQFLLRPSKNKVIKMWAESEEALHS